MRKKSTQQTFTGTQNMTTAFRWLLFFGLIFGIQNSFAQKTWDGGGDGTTWASANNWNPNGVPTALQSVTIVSGQTVTVNAAAVASGLTNSGTLNLNANLTISNGGNFTNLSGGTVAFNSAAVVNGGGGGANGVLVAIASGSTIRTANAAGVDASFAQNAGNRGQVFDSGASYVFTAAGNQTAGFVNTTMSNLTISNTAGTVTLNAATTVTGGLLISNGGGSLTGGSFTHNLAGNWVNNGTFVAGTSTINLNGTSQSIGGNNTTFYNLTLSNGTKTFGVPTTISNRLTISAGAVADFGSITTHTAGTLTLGTLGTNTGTFGSTSSAASFKNNTYFTPGTTGLITVNGSSTCTTPTITLSAIPSICPGATSYTIPYTATTGGVDLYTISGTGITSVTNGAFSSSPFTIALSSPATTGTISPTVFNVSSSVTGCVSANLNGNVTVLNNVGVPSFTAGATTVCQNAANTTYTATATNSTGITYSVAPVGAGTIGSSTGIMDWNAAFSGAATITASAAGCNGPQTADRVVTVTPTVGTPSFTAGATTVCQNAADETYTATATDSTGITYSVAPGTAGTIGSSSGVMNWNAAFSGTATITASAAGCNGPATANRVVSVTPTVGTPSFTAGATTVCQDNADTTYTATATNNTGITYSVSPVGAGVIGSSSGIMNWDANFSGTATITASAAGCNGPITADRVVTVTPTVGTPVFSAGATSLCQDAADETYTATASNSTGITYSVAPGAAGIIGLNTGVMNWNASFSGTATITASATGCNGPVTEDRVVTVNASPIVTADDVSGCANTPIALSGSGTPTGGSGNFSVPNPYVGASSTTYTFTYTDLNGCSATSAPANITIIAPPTWYLDADNDQYYTGTGITSCTSPGAGYTITVLGGGDCNDAVAGINPGAAEICYNNIDDNCNTTLSEGCAPVVVNMNPTYNNTTLQSLSIAIPALPYSYAPYTNLKYRFSITNVTTGITAPDIIQVSRFVTIPAALHSYNAQYTITASAVINEEVVPFAGNTITINSPTVQLITLNSATCGATLASLNSTLTANAGLNATGYTFRIRLNDANPTPTYAYSQSSTRFIGANTFSGLPLQYSTSYKVAVQYSFNDPVTNLPTQSGYGAECTVNTPSIPLTNLSSPVCGSQVTSMNAAITSAAAPYATGYQFRIRLFSDNGPTPTYYYTLVNASRFSSLGAFQGITLTHNTEYSISVQYSVLQGATTVWSGYGAECKVITPNAPAKMEMGITGDVTTFKAVAYPNPFAENFMLDVKSESQSIVNIKVYDMVGRMIEQVNARPSDMETTTIGSQYPSGVYNVIVTQEDSVQSVRVIKR